MRRTAFLTVLLVLALTACGGEPDDGRPASTPDPAVATGRAENFELRVIARGLTRPTWVGEAPGDPRPWALEQPGRVMRLEGGRPQVVGDISAMVQTGAEQGLLGIAFHPDFARNRRLFLHWSAKGSGDTRVAEFRAGRDGRIDPRPRRMLLELEQPEENHNGGQLAFAPDGRLYLGLGDGGGAFDPQDNAQDERDLLGKIVSTDVDRPGEPDWRVELYGLRNPWRFWFDPALNEVWIADVGQDAYEEIDRVALEPDEPPKNLGWPVYEGATELQGRDAEGKELRGGGELLFPVAGYTHEEGGCSVIGGLIYRGRRIDALMGRYVYGDFCSGALFSLRPAAGAGATDVRRERAELPQVTHIGADSRGELLMSAATGEIFQVAGLRVP